MTIEEAIKLLDPKTRKNELDKRSDYLRQIEATFSAGQIVVEELQRLIAFKKHFDDLYGAGLKITSCYLNTNILKLFDDLYEEACNDYERTKLDKC